MTYLKKEHFLQVINNNNLETTNLKINRVSRNSVKFNCDEYNGTIYIDTIIYLFDRNTKKIIISKKWYRIRTPTRKY